MNSVEKIILLKKGIGTPLKRFKAVARDNIIYYFTYEQADNPPISREDWNKSFGADGLVITIEIKEMARQNIVQVEIEKNGKKSSSQTFRFGVNTVIEMDYC